MNTNSENQNTEVDVEGTAKTSSRDVTDEFSSTDSHEVDQNAALPDTAYVEKINQRLANIESSEQRVFSEIREMHKLYHSEFAGRLKSMQEEIDYYRKIDKGRIFDDILFVIAKIYCDNESLEEEVQEPKAKKSIRYLLMDLEDLLQLYGVQLLKSKPGDKRNPRHCQVCERIATDNPTLHDTIAKSYNTGAYIDNRTIIKELVDIYIFTGNQ